MNQKQSKTLTWNYFNYSYSKKKKISKEEKMQTRYVKIWFPEW